jgi:polysaccharide biosynthesis protein PelA
MKHLCCNRFLLLFLLCVTALYGALNDKSAVVYLGDSISYPMVGIHDYIIVNPKKTNPYTHGFEVYNNKIYARIVVDGKSTPLLQDTLAQLKQKGFTNFFFDLQNSASSKQFIELLTNLKVQNTFKDTKIILHSEDKNLLSRVTSLINAVLIYNGSKKTDLQTKFYKDLKLDIIDVETSSNTNIADIQKLNFIPYITTPSMRNYGRSSKNPFKREILTLIDERTQDRMESSAHQYGAIPLEYFGYIQTLHNIYDGLPDPDQMQQYAGVVIWLTVDYNAPAKLIAWVKEVSKKKIPIVFASSFGFNVSGTYLKQLGINTYDGREKVSKTIIQKDPMMDYEIQTPLNHSHFYFESPNKSHNLITYKDSDSLTSTTAAITPWGGYALDTSFMTEVEGENIWVINPFKFFKEALRLQDLPAPDPTTENGSRLFFTHIDGDGIMNGVEFNPELVSGDIIYEEILKKYHFPHSVSVIGAEIMPNGLYPKDSARLSKIAHDMYALENVEPATHTFTHPFFWGEIKNGNLKEEYRLKPKGYKFSLAYELSGMLDYIQNNLLDHNSSKKAQTVYWSGDCIPRVNALEYTYKHHILNINGGDTTINNASPWLALVAPFGLQRGEYYQIYTGAQNENVFTHDWLGPFWGFKKVVQTFKLTNSPKRLKPIDVYYHLYSGSKKASLNALRYVFNWVLKQDDIMPVYASEYIPKVMDYYTVSIAKGENENWLFDGMKNLKTLRIESKDAGVDLKNSTTTLGVQHFENHTYISLDPNSKHIVKSVKDQSKKIPYIISSNGKTVTHSYTYNSQHYEFKAHVPLKIKLYLPKTCVLDSLVESGIKEQNNNIVKIEYKSTKKASIDVRCR